LTLCTLFFASVSSFLWLVGDREDQHHHWSVKRSPATTHTVHITQPLKLQDTHHQWVALLWENTVQWEPHPTPAPTMWSP